MLIGKGVNFSLNVWQNSSVNQFESGDFGCWEFLHYELNFSNSYKAGPCNYPFHIEAVGVCIMSIGCIMHSFYYISSCRVICIISYFSVPVITYHDQSSLRKRVYSSSWLKEDRKNIIARRHGMADKREAGGSTCRKQRERIGNQASLQMLQAHSQWCTSSSKVHFPKVSITIP